MNREDYIEEIALMVVEKLNELNKEHNVDLVELLKNNVSVQIIPINTIKAADGDVPEGSDEMQDIHAMQKDIMNRVLAELQKKDHMELMS